MIGNLWGMLELYCDNGHKEPVHMQIRQKGGIFEYECTSSDGCRNCITSVDAEKLLDILSEAMEADGVSVNLTGYKFKFKTFRCRVLSHDTKHIRVAVLDTRYKSR